MTPGSLQHRLADARMRVHFLEKDLRSERVTLALLEAEYERSVELGKVDTVRPPAPAAYAVECDDDWATFLNSDPERDNNDWEHP